MKMSGEQRPGQKWLVLGRLSMLLAVGFEELLCSVKAAPSVSSQRAFITSGLGFIKSLLSSHPGFISISTSNVQYVSWCSDVKLTVYSLSKSPSHDE